MLTDVDLSRFTSVTYQLLSAIVLSSVSDCIELAVIDLSALTSVTSIGSNFLRGCVALTTINQMRSLQ